MAVIAFGAGIAVWLIVAAIGGDVSPLDAGKNMLLAVGMAGFLLALAEGELTWHALIALFAGQVAALWGESLSQATLPASALQKVLFVLHPTTRLGRPFLVDALFLLPFNLTAAIGGALGAAAVGLARLRSAKGGPPAEV